MAPLDGSFKSGIPFVTKAIKRNSLMRLIRWNIPFHLCGLLIHYFPLFYWFILLLLLLFSTWCHPDKGNFFTRWFSSTRKLLWWTSVSLLIFPLTILSCRPLKPPFLYFLFNSILEVLGFIDFILMLIEKPVILWLVRAWRLLHGLGELYA